MRIKYIEEKPIKQVLTFENGSEWGKFFDNKFNEIYSLYGMNYKDNWIYSYFKIKKNGEPAQHNHKPFHLWSKKAQKNQRKGFDEYCEKRKKETRERNNLRKMADIQFKINQLLKEKAELKGKNI